MMKKGKRLIAVSLLLAILIAAFPQTAFVKEESISGEILFDKDFEEYDEGGDITVYTGDIYSSSTASNRTEWSVNNASYAEVCREAYDVNNKVHRLYNDTSASVTAYFAKMVRMQSGYAPRFSLSFRINPKGIRNFVRARRYGGTNANISLFEIASNGDILILGKKAVTVQTNKWMNIKLDVYIPENTMVAFVDSEPVYMGEYLSNGAVEDGNYYNIEFCSVLSSNSESYWDDVLIHTLDEPSAEGEVKGDNLSEYEGVHPRLIFEQDDFENLKKKILMPEYERQWASMKKAADKCIEDGPVKYYEDANIEDLWMRNVATDIRTLTFVYKLSGEEKYKDMATAYVQEVISYPSWGRGVFLNGDLAAGHLIQALAYYYDWLYHDLDANERYLVYKTLVDKVPRLGAWWNMSYLQNHLWRNAGAWYAAAVAIYDEYDGAYDWFYRANRWYSFVLQYLPKDGCNHESFMYWVYGIDALIDYSESAKKFHNIDMFAHPYLQQTANYAMQMVLPTSYNGATDKMYRIADHGNTAGTEWIGLMAWLASRNEDPEAQWYAEKYAELNPDSFSYAFNYIRFYDPEIKSISPEEAKAPLVYRFDDLEMLFMRDNYSDTATCLTYRCGPPLGHQVLGYYASGDVGTGHEHDDLNSPQIYAYGEDLLGETNYGGVTSASHNTILIDGIGQEVLNAGSGYGAKWNKNGEIVKVEETDEYVYSVGRGTESYDLDETYGFGWDRHFLWLKSNVLIVIDEVDLAKEDAVIEQRWWPESQNGKYNSDGSSIFTGNASKLKIRPFNIDGNTEIFYGNEDKLMGSGNPVSMLLVNVKSKGTSVMPTALSWSSLEGTPDEVGCEKITEDIYRFFTNDKAVTVDIENMSVEVEALAEGMKVRKDLVTVKPGVALENVNDRFYVSQNDIASLTNVPAKYDAQKGVLTIEKDMKKSQMKIGDNSYIINSDTFEMDATPYINDSGEAMFPIKYVGLLTGTGAEWDEENGILYLTTGIDFDNVDLKAINVCNTNIEIQEGVKEYEVSIFADDITISATAENPFANVRYELCDDVFGESKIYVSNPDGTKVNEYLIKTVYTTGIGDVPIYNMGYISSDGNIGENVFDQDYGTRWSVSGTGQWLWMDLGKARKLKSVLVATYKGDTRKTGFEIEVSDDKVNWKKVKEFMTSGTTNEAEEYSLDNIETRYIRFVGNGVNGEGGWNSITEIGLILAE